MIEQYYYANDGKRAGPVPFADLREMAAKGELNRRGKVWCPGMKEWQQAGSVAQLFEGLPPDFEPEAQTPPRFPLDEAQVATTGQTPTPVTETAQPGNPNLSAARKRPSINHNRVRHLIAGLLILIILAAVYQMAPGLMKYWKAEQRTYKQESQERQEQVARETRKQAILSAQRYAMTNRWLLEFDKTKAELLNAKLFPTAKQSTINVMVAALVACDRDKHNGLKVSNGIRPSYEEMQDALFAEQCLTLFKSKDKLDEH